jgi:hypothetical protein
MVALIIGDPLAGQNPQRAQFHKLAVAPNGA